MDFRELTYICAIAEHQTISRAAQVLYISQPSLSIFLQKLEAKLNVTLFERANKKMIPTYAGRRYLEYAENILNMHQRLLTEMKGISQETKGCLSIGSTPTRTRYVLPQLLAIFREKYPQIILNITEATTGELENLLDEHIIDFAFYTIPQRDGRREYHHLNWEEIVFCVAKEKNYKLKAKTRKGFLYPWLDLREMEEEIFLLVPEHWTAGCVARRHINEAKIFPQTILFSIVETAVAAAGYGVGVCFCPDIMIRRGTFTHVPDYYSVGASPSHVEFVIAHRNDFELTMYGRDFIKMAQQMLSDNQRQN